MPELEYMKKLAEQMSKGELNFLDENDEFVFACDQCGKCCRNRGDILLSPLDLYNLVKATGKDIMEIIHRYGDCYIGSHSNLPVVRLKFREDWDGTSTCFFLGRKDGKFFCRVHDYKPGVCRTYPLGKAAAFEKDSEGALPKAPGYFLQEEPPKGVCVGLDRAKSENIKQRVIDWVGGSERKQISDMYSQIFNGFAREFGNRLNPSKLRKSQMLYNIYYTCVSALMYSDYDFSVDPGQFLAKMAVNMKMILDFTDIAMKTPDKLLKWSKEAREKKEQGLHPDEAV